LKIVAKARGKAVKARYLEKKSPLNYTKSRSRLGLLLEPPGKEVVEMESQQIPPIFKLIADNALQPRSQQADEAGRLFVLGRLTIAEYIAALNKKGAPR
jgi:hypothetical protein